MHHWLAAASSRFWQAGFCISKIEAGGVCGWMFLACVSEAFQCAGTEPRVLAEEAGCESAAGSGGAADVGGARLAGAAGVGA